MRCSTLFLFSLLSLALPFATQATSHAHSNAAHHNALARRPRGDVDLHKRDGNVFEGARLTYYAVGLGACGKYNVPSDFIVALNVPQYGSGYPGPNCFRDITISYGGKTAVATIMDECEDCPYGAIDASQDLFTYFAPTSVGELWVEWWFNDDPPAPTSTWQPPPPTSTWQPPPSSTWVPPPKPTSTWVPPPPTTTWKPSTTTSSSSSTHSKTTHSSSSVESSTTSTHTTSTTTSAAVETPTGPAIIESMNQALLGIGAIVAAGVQGNN